MLKTIWGELKGVFGKAYLFAGALPAALLVFGWAWFQTRDPLATVLGDAARAVTADAPADPVLAAMAISLALGLGFFAGREPLLDLMKRLPGGPLRGLRRAMARRQYESWLRAQREEAEKLHLSTVVDGWPRRTRFTVPTEPPPNEPLPNKPPVLAASAEARRVLAGLAQGQPLTRALTREERDAIVGGLRGLHAYCREHATAGHCAGELAIWRSLIATAGQDREGKPRCANRACQVLEGLANEIHREWLEARERLDQYPDPRWLRPTALGRISSAFDDYGQSRYGIATSTIVERLLGILPEDDKKAIADARLQIETLINLAAAMTLLAVGVGLHSVVAGVRHLWSDGSTFLGLGLGGDLVFDLRISLFLVVPALLAWLFYRAGVFSHDALAEKMRRAVDLHRLDLVAKLGFERPRDAREERELWTELGGFFDDGNPLDPNRPIAPAASE